MQQLQVFGKEFDALKKLNVETVAIGTDDLEASKVLKNNKDGVKFPMPILADPKQEVFKLYQAFDDFEGQPLHGAVLIDGQGNVRFQRISADPFLDVEFIKGEAARVGRILGGVVIKAGTKVGSRYVFSLACKIAVSRGRCGASEQNDSGNQKGWHDQEQAGDDVLGGGAGHLRRRRRRGQGVAQGGGHPSASPKMSETLPISEGDQMSPRK